MWGGLWGFLNKIVKDFRSCFIGASVSFSIAFLTITIVSAAVSDPVVMAAVGSALQAVSAVVFFSLFRNQEIDTVTWPESRELDSTSTHMVLRPIAAGFVLACFCVYYGEQLGPVSLLTSVSVGALLGATGLIAYALARKELPSFFFESWTFFILQIAMVLTLVLGPSVLLSLVFGAAFCVYYLLYFLALVVTVEKNNLLAFEHFAARMHRTILGVVLGLAICLGLSFALEQGIAFAIVVVVAVALLSLNSMRDSYYWHEWAGLNRYMNGIAEADEDVQLGSAATAALDWEEVCADIAHGFGLSERESDVFALLAKGRNAALISELLFVSTSTARTHIYRIYSKTGLKNQQELITLVEEEQQKRSAKR